MKKHLQVPVGAKPGQPPDRYGRQMFVDIGLRDRSKAGPSRPSTGEDFVAFLRAALTASHCGSHCQGTRRGPRVVSHPATFENKRCGPAEGGTGSPRTFKKLRNRVCHYQCCRKETKYGLSREPSACQPPGLPAEVGRQSRCNSMAARPNGGHRLGDVTRRQSKRWKQTLKNFGETAKENFGKPAEET